MNYREEYTLSHKMVDPHADPAREREEWELQFHFNDRLISFIPLGTHSRLSPIIRQAAGLVQLLNAAREPNA